MIFRRFVFLFSILTTLAFTTRDSVYQSTSVVLSSESSLYVKGTTNVSNFSCVFNVNKFRNPIQVTYRMEGGKMAFHKTVLILDNDCFDCGGKAINSDFQKILKSDKHPQIKLYLKEISQIENSINVHALVNIEIAGISKGYKIPVKVKNKESLYISGNLALSLADYKLESPKKLFGLISVDDTIEIAFELGVKEK